jgi:hypothetical protein
VGCLALVFLGPCPEIRLHGGPRRNITHNLR